MNGNVPLRRGGGEGGGADTERASEGGREALVGEEEGAVEVKGMRLSEFVIATALTRC